MQSNVDTIVCIVSSLSAHCCIITGNFHLLTIGDRCTKYIPDSRSVLFDTGIPSMHIFFNVSYEFTSKWLSCTLLQLQVHTLLYFVHFYVCHIFFIRLFVDSGISVFYSFLSCYSLLFLFVVLYVLWVLMADSNK